MATATGQNATRYRTTK
nr:unnamed protein product [Callosobruchus chinensis]